MSRMKSLVTLVSLIISLSASGSPAHAQITQKTPQRLVVLPFRNLNQSTEDQWLGESFAENITVALSQSSSLELVERSQLELVMQEQGFGQSAYADENSAPRLGRLMGAQQMLLGSYQKQGQQLMVNARLVDVETGLIQGQQSVQLQGDVNQLFSLQSQLATQLLRRLNINRSNADLQSLEQQLKMTDSTTAYAKYQQGLILARSLADQDMQQAIQLFQQAIELEPGFTLAYVALAEALAQRTSKSFFFPSHQADDLENALKYAQKALSHKQNTDAVYRALARVYEARDQIPEAVNAIEEALKQKPGDTDSILVYLDLHGAKLGHVENLKQDLQRFEANTQDPWIQFSLAMIYIKYHKQRQGMDLSIPRKLLMNVRQQLPQYAFVPIKLAWVATLEHKDEQAYQWIQEALAMEPENYMIQFKAGSLLSSTQAYQAEAEQHLKKSLALKPDFAYTESQLGRFYYLQGRDQEARQYLILSNQHLPECATTLAYLGLVAERQGQDAQAYAYMLQALDKAGKLHNETVDRGILQIHLSRMALKLNQPQQAESYAREALQSLDVSPSQVYQQLIAIPLANKDFARALALFSEYQQRPGIQLTDADQALYRRIYLLQQLESKPNDPALLNDLGGLALLTGQISEAENYLVRALQLAPQNPAILFNQGLLKLQAKDYTQSIRIFEQVLQQDPHHRKAAFNLGQAQLRAGQASLARQTWEQLLEAHPDDREALQALESL